MDRGLQIGSNNPIDWRRNPDLLKRQGIFSCHEFNCIRNDLLRLAISLVVMRLRVRVFLNLIMRPQKWVGVNPTRFICGLIYLLSLAMTTLFWPLQWLWIGCVHIGLLRIAFVFAKESIVMPTLAVIAGLTRNLIKRKTILVRIRPTHSAPSQFGILALLSNLIAIELQRFSRTQSH